MPVQRGKYIIIEGQDGTGKTTQADLLSQYLESRGIHTLHVKEPGGSPVAEAIRGVLLDSTLERTPMTNILLFTANRHELWHAVIDPALAAGTWVVGTRNYWSTLAYQGYGEGMDLGVIEAITHTFTDNTYMHPDASLILAFDNIAARQARLAERGELATPDTFESKADGFQTRVQDAYHVIAKNFSLPVIDASQTRETMHDEIIQVIQRHHLLPE